MTLEHLGLAVADADAAVALFERLLDAAPYKTETVEREGVRTVFFGDGGEPGRAPKLELLEALGPESPVARFLEKRGPGLHHVAFEVEDLEAALARARALGFEPLADRPKPGADGKRIAFLHPRTTAGVLVELCESAVAWEGLDVPFAGGTLAAQVAGPPDAPPLVVLHGALDAASYQTAPLARRLAADFRVHTLDFPAHGASGAFEGVALSTGLFTDAVVALLDAAGLARAHAFGFSLGGSVALHAATRHPGRFGRLAVHAAHVQWTREEEAEMGARAASALASPATLWRPALAALHGEARVDDLVARMRAFTNGFLTDDALGALPHPTLVSVGDRDQFLQASLHLRATIPDARLWVLPGLDHALLGADARAFAGEIRRHLLG